MSSSENLHWTGAAKDTGDAAPTTTEKIKHQAAEATTRAKDAASEIAREQRDDVADRIGHVSAALHDSAESNRPSDPNLAWLTEQAATRLQRAADYVRGCSWSQLRDEGSQLARNHPVAFYGGLFVLGALAGAAIKAGAQAVVPDQDEPLPDAENSPVAAGANSSVSTPIL